MISPIFRPPAAHPRTVRATPPSTDSLAPVSNAHRRAVGSTRLTLAFHPEPRRALPSIGSYADKPAKRSPETVRARFADAVTRSHETLRGTRAYESRFVSRFAALRERAAVTHCPRRSPRRYSHHYGPPSAFPPIPVSDLLSANPAPPRELTAFLTELAVAVHTHGVYPAGHPLRARTSQALLASAGALLRERATVSIGAARRQLVVEGVATPEEHPLLSGLAERLHRMRVGAVTLHRGIEPGEMDALLAALSAEPERGGGARPESWPESAHLRLHPLRFGDLEMAETEPDARPDAETSRASELWKGLAQAAAAGEGSPPADASGADAVARSIDGHPAAEGYDQTVSGFLTQLTEELRSDGASAAVRVRASELVASLSPDTLRRLLRMGGDAAQRRRFVLDASRVFTSEAVVRVVEAAAEASGQTVSHSLLRMLQKLAAHAEGGDGAAAAEADAALAEQVRALTEGWSLDDPNPGAYTAVLQRLTEAPARLSALTGPDGWPPEPDRTVRMALETDGDGGAARGAVARMLADGRAGELVAILAEAPAGSGFAEAAWELAASADGIRRLLQERQPETEALDRVLARMGGRAIPVLLDAMANSPSRMVRRLAFDRLAALGPAAGEAAVARADDERWFVVRNVLSLLAEAGAPTGFSPAPFLRHADLRVRREAFKLAFRIPAERTRAVCLALAEDDGASVRMALSDALAGCPPEAVPMVCRHAAAPGGDAEVRALAFRVLGTTAEAMALRTLLAALDGGRDWLGRRRLPARSPEVLAALAALRAGWAAHPAAGDVLTRARRSGDALVRAAAGGAA
jgi:hypothetical protein